MSRTEAQYERTLKIKVNCSTFNFGSLSLQEFSGSSPKRRRAEEKDEGIGSPDTLEEEKVEEVRREMLELRQQLDRERSARMQLEEQVRRKQEPGVKVCLHDSFSF